MPRRGRSAAGGAGETASSCSSARQRAHTQRARRRSEPGAERRCETRALGARGAIGPGLSFPGAGGPGPPPAGRLRTASSAAPEAVPGPEDWMLAWKILVTAVVVAGTSWLSGRSPGLAGFIVALPITSMLVLPFSRADHADPAVAIGFARSIFFAIPLSLTFFLPFLFAERLALGFWQAYAAGCALLVASYLVHQAIVGAA